MELIEFIKNKYADVNSVDNRDKTPFLTTFINCSLKCIEYFIKNWMAVDIDCYSVPMFLSWV